MIKEKVFPVENNNYSLAYDSDAVVGTIGPSGYKWRYFNEEEIENFSEEQKKIFDNFTKASGTGLASERLS